ncbi:phthalate transporter [Brevundimonas sp.]|uniref:phthalate transporter n=1 Tax=Brevundimonas sp. TaxID=1871086 RepID=UPI003BAD160C
MIPRFERPEDLPGQVRVIPRRTPGAFAMASLAAMAWPPLVLTLFVWPPQNWVPGSEIDWRLLVLLIGLIAAPIGLWLMLRQRERTGRPGSRLGVVWRFMLFGGLLAAALQVLIAIVMMLLGWFEAGNALQAMGATETVLLIYGVGGLPVAILVGVSYSLWAGLCAAFIAFEGAPTAVRDRLGILPQDR